MPGLAAVCVSHPINLLEADTNKAQAQMEVDSRESVGRPARGAVKPAKPDSNL